MSRYRGLGSAGLLLHVPAPMNHLSPPRLIARLPARVARPLVPGARRSEIVQAGPGPCAAWTSLRVWLLASPPMAWLRGLFWLVFLAGAYWFSSCAFLRVQPTGIAQMPCDEPGDCSAFGGFSGAEWIRDAAVQ